MNQTTICRGDIYWVDLEPTKGGEQQKQRPCVILNEIPSSQDVWLAAPLVKWKSGHEAQPHLFQKITPSNTNSLDETRTVDVFQTRAVSILRFEKGLGDVLYKRGFLGESEMDFVSDALYIVIGGKLV